MKLLPLLSLLQAVLVHGHYEFSQIVLNDNVLGAGYIRSHTGWIMPLYSNRGILDSIDLRCNSGAKADGSTKTLTVTAGDKVGFKLDQGELIDHPGPSLIYLSKAPTGGVATYDGSGDWFKVYESGLCGKNGKQPDPYIDWCLYNSDRVEFTIPNTLPAGEYLARVEMLALHNARAGEVQIYPECGQLRVVNTTGGGTPGPMAKIPGLYSKSDPGLTYDINIGLAAAGPYPMPGPMLWNGK